MCLSAMSRTTVGSEYIFKVHNGVESDNKPFLDGMQALLLHLRANGITAPFPVNSTAGDWAVPIQLTLRDGTVWYSQMFLSDIG